MCDPNVVMYFLDLFGVSSFYFTIAVLFSC